MREQLLLLSCRKQSKYLLTFLFLIIVSSLFAQKITVVDSDDNPLVGVLIFSVDQNYSASTDIDGAADLIDNITFPLNFRLLGYKELSLSKEQVIKSNYRISMSDEKVILDEIVFIGRTDIAQQDLAFESTTISSADIQLTNAQTTTDALTANSNVYIQKSQMGGGSPVIRGFEANKLLLVIDGVRMNNAIYRSGHLQNAITVDPAILESMEVIFGPGSLMYGSDALGGVVHFQSKSLNLTKNEPGSFEGNYYARYGSSNNEKTAHLDFTLYKKKWASLTSVSISDFGDLRIGGNRSSKYDANYALRPEYVIPGNATSEDEIVSNDDPLRLVSTAYTQYDITQKFKFQPSKNLSLIWNNQFSTSSNIPRYDALTEISGGSLRYSEWNYGPQKRFLSSLSLKYVPSANKFYEKAQLIVAYQNVDEIRISSRYKSDLIAEQKENLNIVNTTLDFNGKSGAHQWYFGADANYNLLDSKAFESRYADPLKREAGLTRYPNGSGQSISSGIYAQYYLIPTSWYKFNFGVRYDYNQLNVVFDQDNIFQWPDYFYDGITNRNHAFNSSTGVHVKLPQNFKIRALVGSSFRAPNIDDISKIRLNSDEISIPNDVLKPEKSLNAELSLAYSTKHTNTSVTAFYTFLSDAIVRQDFALPNGDRMYITEGDTFNIVANVNSDNATIQGISFNLNQKINKSLTIDGSLNFTKGDIIVSEGELAPLAHIPPTYGRLFVQFDQKKWRARVGTRFNGTKDILRFGGSTDNPEFATQTGSLSWYTIHATVDYAILPAFSIQLGVDNALDQFYVPFASGVPGAGRHLSATLRGSF